LTDDWKVLSRCKINVCFSAECQELLW
jgi:hypothetical protein